VNDKAISPLLARLLERLEGQESLELEFKAARGGLPRDLWPTVSAFANTSGGWIVLGVEEVDDVPTVSGVSNAAKLLQDFHNLLRNSQKISHPICGASDASIEPLGDEQLIILRVPAAPRKMRPVYVDGNPYVGTYVRRNSGDYCCNKPEVDRMMREASDVAADSTVLTHFGWEDLDQQALARYRRRFQTRDSASPWNSHDDRRFLQAIGGWRRDREAAKEGITVAGLLLLGTNEALRDWRTRHLIDYRLVPSDVDPDADTNSDARWEDRVPWEGHLFGAFETIYPRLTDGQRVPFRLEGGARVGEGPVHVVVREALVNLLVHTDYAETQVSLIKRSPEGYSFRNPGSSRVLETDLLNGDRSDPRNPVLVRMFRLIGLADEAGTGMPKIIKAWRGLGFHLPAIDVGTERYEFTLDLRHAHLLLEEDRAWLRSLGQEWDEAEQLALVHARHEGDVDNLRLRRLTGQHPADVTRVLGGLRHRGLLQMIGGGRGARYELGPATVNALGAVGVPGGHRVGAQLALKDAGQSPAAAGLSSRGTERSPGGSAPSPGDSEPSSKDLGASSKDFSPSPEDLSPDLGDLNPSLEDLWPDLEEIARVARERPYIDVASRDRVLIDLCARVPLSVRELARLMRRSEPYIREALRPLVASGRLTFLYSSQPSHPRQKYTAVQGEANVQQGTEQTS
jgi:ATP-dependent DNA helicase RecG